MAVTATRRGRGRRRRRGSDESLHSGRGTAGQYEPVAVAAEVGMEIFAFGQGHGHDEEAAFDALRCIFCRINQAVVAFVPCGHLNTCIACVKTWASQNLYLKCPSCNTDQTCVLRVYQAGV